MVQVNALTIAGQGPLRVLKCGMQVGTPALDYSKPSDRMTSQVDAIWDTGASISVITQSVVDQLGIQPISMTVVHGVQGQQTSPVFLVDFYLPSAVVVRGMNVTLGKLLDADVLIGMDVITAGDFVITNAGGRTKMTFRVPSMSDIDYVKDANNQGTTRAERRQAERAAAKRERRSQSR